MRRFDSREIIIRVDRINRESVELSLPQEDDSKGRCVKEGEMLEVGFPTFVVGRVPPDEFHVEPSGRVKLLEIHLEHPRTATVRMSSRQHSDPVREVREGDTIHYHFPKFK